MYFALTFGVNSINGMRIREDVSVRVSKKCWEFLLPIPGSEMWSFFQVCHLRNALEVEGDSLYSTECPWSFLLFYWETLVL